jgi:putative aldouronate transport system substrate-binding protein
MSPYGKYAETVTISIPKKASPDPRFVEGESIGDNCLTRAIKDRLNVQVEIAWEVEASEYINKLSLNIASNDLPDAFTLDATVDYLVYKSLVENDMLAELTVGYEKCAGEYMHMTFDSFEEKNLAPFIEDGKLMGIAGGFYGYEHNLLWIRNDWLAKYGLQAPKSLDEVETVIKTFIDNNAGGKGNVGLVMEAKYPASSNMYAATPVFGAVGAYPKNWIKDASGKVVWGSVAPEMKAGLQILADWYAEGLIDKQFPTRTASGAVDALVKDGQTGIWFAPWWDTYVLFPDFPKNNPDAEIMAYNAPLDANGKFNILWPGPANTVICVNKNFENPEAVVKMLNVEFDAWRGIDEELNAMVRPSIDAGTDWTYLFPTGGVNLEFADCIPNVGYLIKNYVDNGVMEGKPGVFHSKFDQSLALDTKTYVDTKSLENSGWIHYYGRYFASNIVNAPEVHIQYPAYSFSTTSMSDLKAYLD